MSDFVVHKGQRALGTFARHYGAAVTNIHYEHGELTAVQLADGRAGSGSCLGCGSPRCIEKDASELSLSGALGAFPGDPSLDVCPTRAIEWDVKGSIAVVSDAHCIGCGLCIIRCPYGAISLADGLVAVVETKDPDQLITAAATSGEHPTVMRNGQIATLDATAANNLPESVLALDDARTNLFVRNLLNEVGLRARSRRRGDTNMRIDAVGLSHPDRPFVVEIETGSSVLESPRALLEDVAVLHSRYGYAVDCIDPISIILTFPNVRSEYYQVIRDIENVLGLRCRTMTIGALVALLWNCLKIDGFSDKAFTVSEEIVDIADCLGIDKATITEPYPGAFSPVK